MAEIRINTTGGLKLYDADNSHYAQIVAGTITSNVDAITLGHDTVTIADNLSLGSDSAILKFGADTEIALTHVADTGLKLTDSGGTPTLQLHDANESIASDGSKVIITSGGTAFSLPTSDGSNGQALVTNGSAVLSFATVSAADPSSADGDSLGTASAEWSDLYLADGGIIYFGNDQDVTLTHDPDDGLFLKSIATADNNPVLLTLQTGETDIAANDVIGAINFQAPDEGTGTDAILVAAGIEAVSEGDFSSSSNATKLSFKTGASEAAAEKMSLSSAGLLTIADDLVIKDGGTIGVSSDADSITIASNGAVTFSQTPVFPDGSIAVADLDIDGATDIGAAIVDADLLIIDDGAGGTNRKTTAARLKTYMGAELSAPVFKATLPNAANINNTTATKMALGTEVLDTGGCYDTTNYRFTPDVEGYYLFIVSGLLYYGNAAGEYGDISVYKNGNKAIGNRNSQSGNMQLSENLRAVGIIHMNGSSDYAEPYIYHQYGTGKDLDNNEDYTYFTGFRITGSV